MLPETPGIPAVAGAQAGDLGFEGIDAALPFLMDAAQQVQQDPAAHAEGSDTGLQFIEATLQALGVGRLA